jgi:hypothetical protein
MMVSLYMQTTDDEGGLIFRIVAVWSWCTYGGLKGFCWGERFDIMVVAFGGERWIITYPQSFAPLLPLEVGVILR